jgi:glucosamine-6-phosphate deaminase
MQNVASFAGAPPALRLSSVEQAVLAASPFQALYPPTEKMPVLVAPNFPALGRLAAMRFLEWVQDNPGGVISLPTGKTPEHFIKWVQRLLAAWDEPETRRLLEESGVDPGRRPDMGRLRFAQIDEFYPIHPSQQNSFHHYVNEFYLKGFGLDPAKALLINCEEIGLDPGQTLEGVWPAMAVDLSLRVRQPRTRLERVQQRTLHRIDQWCQEYEARIRALGGIGFFLGGVGPDGHIGFNIRGSDHFSTTRLTPTNYETQAAAATDLGGVEISRKRLVITIGLGTIAFNPECAAIILAAGEAKAGVIADAVQSDPTVLVPATVLHRLPNARCYVTQGAAKGLIERRVAQIAACDRASDESVEKALVDLSVRTGKRLTALTDEDAKADAPTGAASAFARRVLAGRAESLADLARVVRDRLAARIEAGARSRENTRFLHTEPHHDDVMLGYLPYVVRNVRIATNQHFFATMTSGFTAVTNHFLLAQLESLGRWLDTPDFARMLATGYFSPGNEKDRNRDVWQYLDGVAADDASMRAEGAARRLLRNLIELTGDTDRAALRRRIEELAAYLREAYPGKKDPENVQRLKGMCREWEAECLWGYFGWKCSNIFHLRLGFYTGDIFTQEPSQQRDVEPILGLMRRTAPDLVTVAFDPEGSGPDTHYKVLRAIHAALAQYADEAARPDVRVWGYRNVWFRFEPHEANLYVPVTLTMLSIMDGAFLNTFISQKEASFPSYEHDGPFCELARRIQVGQYQAMKTCLGREWFNEHPSALIRATRGLVFLREMTLEEFGGTVERLRKVTEHCPDDSR